MIAAGVASPKAQGQEITSTEMPMESANSKLYPAISHTAAATMAIPITAGTKIALILSASLAIGALVAVASSTSLIISESAVSLPIFSARILKYPALLTVPPITLCPVCFSAGTLSPVSADSSTEAKPSIITPSTGIAAPALTITVSPIATSSVGTVSSLPSRRTIAVLGVRSISFVIASDVLRFALASNVFPSVISVSIIPADSKYISIIKAWATTVFP